MSANLATLLKSLASRIRLQIYGMALADSPHYAVSKIRRDHAARTVTIEISGQKIEDRKKSLPNLLHPDSRLLRNP